MGDDDWGDLDDLSDKNKKGLGGGKAGKPIDDKNVADKKRQNLFFG